MIGATGPHFTVIQRLAQVWAILRQRPLKAHRAWPPGVIMRETCLTHHACGFTHYHCTSDKEAT
jgi:hypothetical protein